MFVKIHIRGYGAAGRGCAIFRLAEEVASGKSKQNPKPSRPGGPTIPFRCTLPRRWKSAESIAGKNPCSTGSTRRNRDDSDPCHAEKRNTEEKVKRGAGVLSFKFVSFKRWGAELANNAASRNDPKVGTARRRRPTPAAKAPLHPRDGAGAPEVWDAGGAASLPIITRVLPHHFCAT
jgi:hypothetical protein